MAKLVSKVYGDALFSLAVEENRVDELWDETRAMKQVLSENPDFRRFFKRNCPRT